MAERVAVRRFNRLPPLAYHLEVGGLERRDFAADIDEIDAGLEPAEQPVRRVEERQGVLIAPHRLHQERELARRLRFVEHRAGADGELDRGPEARFRQGGAAGLAVDHADHLIRFGFVGAGVELVEDRQRGLRHAPRFVVALAQEMRLGVVDQAHAL